MGMAAGVEYNLASIKKAWKNSEQSNSFFSYPMANI
jgi:hypothetical protein